MRNKTCRKIEDIKFVFRGPTKKEKELYVIKCIKGLKGKNDRDFYQSVAAAEYVGGDDRLIEPLIEAYKKRRGWKRGLALQAIKYLKYDKLMGNQETLSSNGTKYR